MSKIILLSGGMDSFINMRLFYPHHTPVFVRTASQYQHLDLTMAQRQSSRLQVIDGPELVEDGRGIVANRNMIILATVANKLGAEEIVVSAPRGEIVNDQQPVFYRKLASLLMGTKIINSLQGYTKTQLVAEFLKYNRARDLAITRSCYSNKEKQCGQCAACFKRWVAMRNNGIDELYMTNPNQVARALKAGASWRAAARYGIIPAYETWKALRYAP